MLSISDAVAVVTLFSGLLIVGLGRRRGRSDAEKKYSYETCDPQVAQWRLSVIAHLSDINKALMRLLENSNDAQRMRHNDPKLMDRIENEVRGMRNDMLRRQRY